MVWPEEERGWVRRPTTGDPDHPRHEPTIPIPCSLSPFVGTATQPRAGPERDPSSRLTTIVCFGDSNTSSSDGRRFPRDVR
jgi:hypothetical protein